MSKVFQENHQSFKHHIRTRMLIINPLICVQSFQTAGHYASSVVTLYWYTKLFSHENILAWVWRERYELFACPIEQQFLNCWQQKGVFPNLSVLRTYPNILHSFAFNFVIIRINDSSEYFYPIISYVYKFKHLADHLDSICFHLNTKQRVLVAVSFKRHVYSPLLIWKAGETTVFELNHKHALKLLSQQKI